MLDILGSSHRLCDGVSRRSFLRIGSLGMAGLALPELLRARASQTSDKRRNTAVILYWMAGGPSHIDTYDMKPSAPEEVRGPFRSVPTKVNGLQLCELLPRHALMADKFSIIRSLHHTHSVHDDGAHWVQTGYPQFNARQVGQRHPCQGSIVSHLCGPNRRGMPAYVCIPQAYSSPLGFYQRSSFLGPDHEALSGGIIPYRGKTPASSFEPHVSLTLPQLDDRKALLEQMNNLKAVANRSNAFDSFDAHRRTAFDLVTSTKVQEAFDLKREPVTLQEKYGAHHWGRSALLARRLVEAGVTFVTINHYEADIDWWDDHTGIEKNLRKRLPPYDQALSALIGDLSDRGLEKDVLVVALGEFGRGPRIDAQGGRGHWTRAYSALLSGGGLKMGQVVGATTADGGEPKERPLGPGDLLATIYHILGLDGEQMIVNKENRPVKLVETGEKIAELC